MNIFEGKSYLVGNNLTFEYDRVESYMEKIISKIESGSEFRHLVGLPFRKALATQHIHGDTKEETAVIRILLRWICTSTKVRFVMIPYLTDDHIGIYFVNNHTIGELFVMPYDMDNNGRIKYDWGDGKWEKEITDMPILYKWEIENL